MVFLSYLRQFLRDVRGQRLRLFLTLFGMVWGTVAVSLLLAFGEGLHAKSLRDQKGLGENIVICWPSRTSRPWQGLPKGRRILVTEEDIDLLRAEVPELSGISGEFSRGGTRFKVGRKTVVPSLVGATPVFGAMRNLIPERGSRFLDPLDLDARKRTVFLGDELRRDLFGERDPVGETVRIGTVPFLVVGAMQAKDQDSSYSGRDSDKAFVPSTTFQSMYGTRYVNNFVMQVTDLARVEEAKQGVVATLARKYRFDPEDHEAVAMWDVTETFRFLQIFFTAFRTFLGIVGALTLVVGGIGVSNIMNVVVEERTREIGIKMALGARRRYVIGQFLFETLLLTAVGGVIGFAITWGICAMVPVFGWDEHIGTPLLSGPVAAATTAILGVIGLLAGIFPARDAANLNPVEAMRM